jgi:hypothetical protein
LLELKPPLLELKPPWPKNKTSSEGGFDQGYYVIELLLIENCILAFIYVKMD